MVWQLMIQKKASVLIRQFLRRYDLLFLFIGIMISTGVLTCTLMLFEGYEKALKESILNFNAHIYFFKPGSHDLGMNDISLINEYLSKQPEVFTSQAVVSGQGMISYGSGLKGVNYRSIDSERKLLPVSYREIITEGTYQLRKETDVVIGKQLAEANHIAVGDTVFMLASGNRDFSLSGIQQMPLTIAGIFNTGMYEYDMKTVFVRPDLALKLTGKQDGSHKNEYTLIEVRIKTEQVENARILAKKWERELNLKYQIYSWIHFNGNIFSLLKLEKWVIGIVLFFLIIIASFSIITSTITTISEEKKKIAILRAIGLKYRVIYQLYFTKMTGFGVAGILCGIISGWGFAHIISKQSFIKMEGQVYLLDAFHVSIQPQTLLLIFVSAFAIVSFSALIALKKLNALDIISVLRMNK